MNKLRQQVTFELKLSKSIDINNKIISYIDVDVQFVVLKNGYEIFLETFEKEIDFNCIKNRFMRNDFGSWFVARYNPNFVLKFNIDKMIINNYTIIPIITSVKICQIENKNEIRSYALRFDKGIKLLKENHINLNNSENSWIDSYCFHTSWELAVTEPNIIEWNEECLKYKLEYNNNCKFDCEEHFMCWSKSIGWKKGE